jgi:hypothetical protein
MTHIVELRTSRDGGRNWSDWRAYDMGIPGSLTGVQHGDGLGLAARYCSSFGIHPLIAAT